MFGRRGILGVLTLIVVHVVILLAMATTEGDGPGDEPERAAAAAGSVPEFADAHDEPPAGWSGPVFRLSQDYPERMPELGPAPWLEFDYQAEPQNYLKALFDYALEGNIAVEFRGQENPVRKWFHAPWLHAGQRGREFIHGLTLERQSRPKELAPTQTKSARNWAVGMYNPRGGYTLGRVWRNRDAPDPRQAAFPEGTVAFKLLFTSAPVSQVPFLKGALEWQADIDRATDTGPRPVVRLLQIDVAVRDSRSDATTGWIFGTFIYNGNALGATVWDRMIPVGAMWGNDPDRLHDDRPLVETVINPEAESLMQHLGYKGRLNGPVDNPASSCLSCHSTAEVPPDMSEETVPGVPPPNSPPQVLERYFRNIPATTPFSDGYLALDYSLQLQNGIVNWAAETNLRYPAPASPFGPQRRFLRASDRIRAAAVSRD
jgi:hypothetical protein